MAQRSKVGHYDIVAELGRGGMGVVFKGFEPSLHRHVAIKMLSESLAHDPLVVERFFREARSMAQLNDPHIVQIYLVGEDQGQPFFAMEFVEGESLSQRLKREHRLAPFEAAKILLQVAQGLAAAHDRGVIHRDIKPANLLINQRGVVKVADFGIALAAQDFNKKLTGTGQFVGTPGYLSPEVCLGKAVDQRSDVFALGIVFFEMLTGQTPYQDESPLGMMLEVVQADIPDVRAINESVDPQLSAILKRMVAKEPADRYPDCHHLIADLVAAGVNTAMPATPPKAVANPIVGTVVNLPTPAEMRRLATPAPAVGYSTQASGAAPLPVPAPVPAPAPARATARKPSLLPWAVAVVALVAAGGGSAWYLKRVADSSALANATVVAPSSAVAAPTTQPVLAVADPTAPATPQMPPPTPQVSPPPIGVPAGDSPAVSSDVNTVTDASSVTDAAEVAVTDVESDPAEPSAVSRFAEPAEPSAVSGFADSGDLADVAAERPPETPMPDRIDVQSDPGAPEPRAGAAALPVSSPSAAIGARLADMREHRLQRRARAEAAGNRQYAKAIPPPVEASAPVYQGPPRVLVLGFGDPVVAGSAELAIEERLDEMGLDLVDEDLISGLSGLENGTADMARLIANAGRHAEFVVAVQVVPMGEQQLTFYGQSMTQYSARLDVAAYDVRNRRKLGTGWNTQVSFTHLNADPNTRQAIAPILGRIAQGLGARGRG